MSLRLDEKFDSPPDRAANHQAYALHWAKVFEAPALLITLELRLIWANIKAHEMLLDGGYFHLNGDSLAFADKSQATDFRFLRRRVSRGRAGDRSTRA